MVLLLFIFYSIFVERFTSNILVDHVPPNARSCERAPPGRQGRARSSLSATLWPHLPPRAWRRAANPPDSRADNLPVFLPVFVMTCIKSLSLSSVIFDSIIPLYLFIYTFIKTKKKSRYEPVSAKDTPEEGRMERRSRHPATINLIWPTAK